MSAVPVALDTDSQPPMTIPLRHFLVAQLFLLVGLGFAITSTLGVFPGRPDLAHVHAMLAGWICLTIVGAMTQFVPVWTGVSLYSRRLAAAGLWLVVGGLLGFVAALAVGVPPGILGFGLVMLAGFWAFVYNLGRTLARARPLDATEWHFAVALGWFLLVTTAGALLAADLVTPLLPETVPRHRLLATHATMAVFGAILTTVLGALFQLVDLFAPTETAHGDATIRRVETATYPIGVLVLAVGRLVGAPAVARIGAVLVLVVLALLVVFLARRLARAWGQWTPMLTRYAVATVALAGWIALTIPVWWRQPAASATVFGPIGGRTLLLFGVVGFVVLGTLYHVVPFIVWVHRYADRVGFEPVPVVDDLYDDLVAVADLLAFVLGTALLLGGTMEPLDHGSGALVLLGSIVLTVGALLFVGNLLLVLRRHGEHSIGTILLGSVGAVVREREKTAPR